MDAEALKLLILRCQKQDRAAQAALYHHFSSRMYAVCLQYARNTDEAKDHLQEGFIHAFDKMYQFGFKGAFEGWLKRIFINRILLSYRKKPMWDVVTESAVAEPEPLAEDEVFDFEMSELLTLIQALPDRYRLVFNLYVMESYSHHDIAVALGISVGTSKSNLSRARAILQRKVLELQEKKNNTNPEYPRKIKGF